MESLREALRIQVIALPLPSHHTGPATRNLHSSISREPPLLEVLRETNGSLMGYIKRIAEFV